MAYKLIEIKGIGPIYAEKLAAEGLKTTDDFLEAAATKKGRNELEEKTGIAGGRILDWANMCDLFRIKGVAEDYSHLLEASGVDTVKELRTRNAANLHAKMEEVNKEKGHVERVPALSQVENWIAQAKELKPKMTY